MKKKINIGYKLWNIAKKKIPGGNSILSKRPERYAGKYWPTYFKKAHGYNIWGIDGKKYIDMAQMGIGSSILGYNNEFVNSHVKKIIDEGINTTLNSYEEVKLADKLTKLNKGYSGVKFCRSGGEAMNVAIRIARSFTRKEKIAFSGYHGWFDWYLATNLQNKKNLNEHLLKGLSAKGVYSGFKKTIYPFKYDNALDFLKVIKKDKKIGIVVVESARYNFPNKKFVSIINDVCKKKNLILICDEITSGFRISETGAYKKVGFKPDLIVYGKGLGNGFAISAIVGKKKIMRNSEKSFISSSNWSERVGFVAALKTLEFIEKKKVWTRLNKMGEIISNGWKAIFAEYKLNIEVSNFLPLVTMKLKYGKLNDYILTYFIRDMLKKGYLVSSSIYLSYSHDDKICKKYLKDCRNTFAQISHLIHTNRIKKVIGKDVRSDSFQRL